MHFSPWPLAKQTVFLAALIASCLTTSVVRAQSTCSSDGQRPSTALLERFINADCATCWADAAATPKARAGELALDWIVPSPRGDDAPLSAAASRDALDRLESLRQSPPAAANFSHKVTTSPFKLRVAHGVALGGYMGASIELTARPGTALPRQPLTAWLLLVEAVPAGTDGTPVARNLVRNALKSPWNINSSLLISEQTAKQPAPPKRLYESRPMSIPAGSNPDRLQVIGWVEDAKGRVIGGAGSVCDKLQAP